MVFATPPQDLDELQVRIQNAVGVLRNEPAMVRRAYQDMLRRCRLCIQRDGGHVEFQMSVPP